MTPNDIAHRMEKAAPGERRAVLRSCARDVGQLYRLKRLFRRQTNEWANALTLWGNRRAGLRPFEATTEVVKGIRGAE